MKSLLLSVLCYCFVFTASGQNIKSDEFDDSDKSRTIYTEAWTGKSFTKKDFIDADSHALLGMTYRNVGGLEMYTLNSIVTRSTLGCAIERQGRAIIVFEDDSTTELIQFSQTDCSATPSIAYAFMSKDDHVNGNWTEAIAENLQKLAANPIKSIRLYGSKGAVELTLKPEKMNIVTLHLASITSKLGK